MSKIQNEPERSRARRSQTKSSRFRISIISQKKNVNSKILRNSLSGSKIQNEPERSGARRSQTKLQRN